MVRSLWIGVICLVGSVSCVEVEDATLRAQDALPPGCPADVLYVSDFGADAFISSDDFVAMFDASTGEFIGYLEGPNSDVLDGPLGILVDKNQQVILANQNFGEAFSGEVITFEPHGNAPPKVLVPPSLVPGAPNAPWIPRGMVLGDHNLLYVADLGVPNPGRITVWNSKTGAWVQDLHWGTYVGTKAPRGILFGPDGFLYVANTNLPNRRGGSILRFDPETGQFDDVVYACVPEVDPTCMLHRPEGLVFGPDGRLYVTSFEDPNNPTDVDRILIFEINEEGEGMLVDWINLWEIGEDRVFSQAILFGPEGKLHVPITSLAPPDTCSIRTYELTTEGGADVWVEGCFAQVGEEEGESPLVMPYYLSFGQTNPTTLAYEPKKQCE
jgi:hypothetical protein